MPKKTAITKRSTSEVTSSPARKQNKSKKLEEKKETIIAKEIYNEAPNTLNSINSQASLAMNLFNKKIDSHKVQHPKKHTKDTFRIRRNTSKFRRSETALQHIDYSAEKNVWRIKDRVSMPPAQEIKLVNSINATESTVVFSIQDEESDDEKFDPIRAKMEFLENFGDLPNLSDISEASSCNSLIGDTDDIERIEEAYAEFEDNNYDMSSNFSITNFEQQQEVEDEDFTVESTNISDMMEYMSESLLTSFTTIEEPPDNDANLLNEKTVNEATIQQLLEFKEPVRITGLSTKNNLEKELFHRVIVDSVELYLNTLIDNVVNKCESDEVQLSRNCDKNQLKRELMSVLELYRATRNITEFLNRRMVEYYLRKRILYPITPTKEIYESRYIKALTELDYTLEKEKQGRILNEGIIQDLNVKELQTRVQLQENIASFETLVRSTLLSRGEFQAINKVVEKQIYTMNEVRTRIRELRRKLFLSQHTYASLKEKLENVNNIGCGLTVQQYLTTQEEVQIMSKKLEEYNMEWKRLFEKMNSGVHSLAHFRLKKQMLNIKLYKARESLNIIKNTVKDLRERNYVANLEHNRLHDKIIEYKTVNFLIHYPLLMIDYDKTVETVLRKTENVQNLKIVRDNLIQKIGKVEANFSQ